MFSPPYSLFDLPLSVHQHIFSYLGPCASYANTCRDLNEIHAMTASYSGLQIGFGVKPELLNAREIPLVNAKSSYPAQGMKIQKSATSLVKKIWPLLSKDQQASFKGISRAVISSSPMLFEKFLVISSSITKEAIEKSQLSAKKTPAHIFTRKWSDVVGQGPLSSTSLSQKTIVSPGSSQVSQIKTREQQFFAQSTQKIQAVAVSTRENWRNPGTASLVLPRENTSRATLHLRIDRPSPKEQALSLPSPNHSWRRTNGNPMTIAPPPPRTDLSQTMPQELRSSSSSNGTACIETLSKKMDSVKLPLPLGCKITLRIKEDIHRNKHLRVIQSKIEDVTSISALDLSNKDLVEIPEEIERLSFLKIFHLDRNFLRFLPNQIGNLPLLTELYLSNNPLESLPSSLKSLANLTRLHLQRTKILEVPPVLRHLTQLTDLDLSGNDLSILPEWIGELSSISTLALSKNQLRDLPRSIGLLTSLTHLWLNKNRLEILPSEIGLLRSLSLLDLGNNQLLNLPLTLTSLQNLRILSLIHNQLKIFPFTSKDFPHMEQLDLSGNAALASSSVSIPSLASFHKGDCKFSCDSVISDSLLCYITEIDPPPSKKKSPPEPMETIGIHEKTQ